MLPAQDQSITFKNIDFKRYSAKWCLSLNVLIPMCTRERPVMGYLLHELSTNYAMLPYWSGEYGVIIHA